MLKETPFADGNGRTGRLWQSLILQKWKEFFAWMPIESLIYEKQEGYYKALNASNVAGELTVGFPVSLSNCSGLSS